MFRIIETGGVRGEVTAAAGLGPMRAKERRASAQVSDPALRSVGLRLELANIDSRACRGSSGAIKHSMDGRHEAILVVLEPVVAHFEGVESGKLA